MAAMTGTSRTQIRRHNHQKYHFGGAAPQRPSPNRKKKKTHRVDAGELCRGGDRRARDPGRRVPRSESSSTRSTPASSVAATAPGEATSGRPQTGDRSRHQRHGDDERESETIAGTREDKQHDVVEDCAPDEPRDSTKP